MVSDNDHICCQKCRKKHHWTCSKLSSYEIKLHKKNPYKPWRCDTCKEKYCKKCEKCFRPDNYESICCDNCSFWFHSTCSELGEDEFQYHSNNPDSTWFCPPCKGKLCICCKISTFRKSKVNCSVCNNLYHTVCAGLPKSKNDDSDWICHPCRSIIFPFHNIDYKALSKMSTAGDKFSLKTLNDIFPNMSRTCSVCLKNLSKSNPGIPCSCCYSKIHVKCSKITDPKNTFHLFKGKWQCSKCMKDKFSFHDIDDESVTDLSFTPVNSKKRVLAEFSIDDKLKMLLTFSSKTNW